MERGTGIFEALGDATRRQILELLAAGEQPAGAVVAALRARAPISQPAVSQHLKVLREARLVRVRAEGNRRYYAIDSAGVDAALAWLARLAEPLGPFAQPLDALATEVARGQRARRAAEVSAAAAGSDVPGAGGSARSRRRASAGGAAAAAGGVVPADVAATGGCLAVRTDPDAGTGMTEPGASRTA
ncbi:MAG: winged helix-turn-helix transcriptional regulator [Frankia sp.]|nr:winged helix-turn-helix transcriptional regulator [Frankia sp.]